MRKFAFGMSVAALVAACGSSSFSGSDIASDAGTDDGSSNADASAPAADSGSGGGNQKDGGPGGMPPPGGEGGAPLDGIFVSVSLGADTNAGTMGAPLKTLKAGMDLGLKLKKTVIACAETYPENLAAVDTVSVYGNYDCSKPKAWAIGGKNAVLMAPQSPAVTATSITKGVTIGHLDIVAPSATAGATGAAKSSIGALVNGSPGLAFANLTITAGDALDGDDQVEPTPLTDNAGTENGVITAGGVNNCNSATYAGGAGGTGGVTTFTCNNQKKWAFVSSTTTAGQGPAPVVGAPGASSAGGTFSSTDGFITGDGTAGKSGTGGKGGDGLDMQGGMFVSLGDPCPVGGQTAKSGAGSGGGAGGCPGLAGLAGTGGGSSVGAVVYGGVVGFTTVSFKTGKGGKGGKGTGGSAPTVGGTPGGKPGTQPGISGSGAGGHSMGIAYGTGSAPLLTTKGTTALGTPGPGVDAIASGDGLRSVPASAVGIAADVYAVP
jgi:hypothetical protein